MIDKEHAKAVAKKEVLKRIKTLEQAKQQYKEWIKYELKNGGYKQETVDFWEEVCRQVDSVCIE